MLALSEDQLTKLHTHLIVPITVGDILYKGGDVGDDVQYALHEMLSEIDPDSALLAIALSAKHIALNMGKDNPIAAALSIESGKIIDDYAEDWLANYNNGPINEETLQALLRHVPEDLECMADILDALRAGMSYEEGPAAMLCDILSIQARAHMEIAQYIIEEIDRDDLPEEEKNQDVIDMSAYRGTNVILFPIHLRR